MSDWQIVFTEEAEKDLGKLTFSVRQRILEKLKWFRVNFNELIPIPLTEKWKGFFKLRIGDWRVIYAIDLLKERIVVHCIDNRDKIYKRNIHHL